MPDTVYGDLVRELHRMNVRVYGDTDGEPLRLTAAEVWIDDQHKRIESAQPIAIESESRSAKAQSFSAPFDAATLQLNSVEMRYALRD